MTTKQHYVIYNQRRGVSKHGGALITIKAKGVTDGNEYITYIDPTNFNSQNWIDITSKPEAGYLVKGMNIKRDNILNADSKFTVLAETHTAEIMLAELDKVWQERNRPKNTFRDLFDDDEQ